jgi:hypothetical protein
MIDAHQREIAAVGAEPRPEARVLEAGALFAVVFSIRAGVRSGGDGGGVEVPQGRRASVRPSQDHLLMRLVNCWLRVGGRVFQSHHQLSKQAA